jgi:intracellular multiplication protein IcmL
MAGDVLQQVGLRNHFYRDSYRTVLVAFLLSVLVNVALAGLAFYQFTHRPRPAYVATSADGTILPRQPLTVPVLSNAQLLQWAQKAIIASSSYDYINYLEQLGKAAQYFSAQGWSDFRKQLQSSRQLQMVIRDKDIVHAIPTGVPTIIDGPKVLGGRLVWLINMPVMVEYITEKGTTTRNVNVTITVQREKISVYPEGVSVRSIVIQAGQDTLGTMGGR